MPVYRQPRIVLLTTGDEVVEPGIPLSEGKIYNINMTMMSARPVSYTHLDVYKRQVLKNCGKFDAESLNEYIASGGFQALEKACLLYTSF